MSSSPTGRLRGTPAAGRGGGSRVGSDVAPELPGRPGSPGGRPAGRPPGHAQPQVWKGVFFAAAALAIVLGAAWALLGSRFLVVRSVRVVGADRLVTPSQVASAAAIPSGLPMIRVSAGQVAHRVERRVRRLASARVSRDWPDTVVITVRLRTAVFAVGRSGRYDLVDASGVAIQQVARRPPGLPLLTVPGGAALVGNPAVRAASEVLRELPGAIAHRVRSVSAADESEVSVRLTDGVTIIWGSAARSGQKAQELAVLMRTRARVYDVSAPGTAVTRG